MRNQPFQTDSYRMMSAMCRVCQSPSSWYNSGPAQKYLLRQIKAMDFCIMNPDKEFRWEKSLGKDERPEELDVCLLTIYGQILFMSTSYSYALSTSRSYA